MGSHRFNPLALALALAAATIAVRATAQTRAPIDLEWQAPPGCPSDAKVEQEIRRLVGDSQRHVLARAVVTREADTRFRVRIDLSGDAEGSRTLTAATCESAGRAGALIIALAIDPQAASVLSDQIEEAETRAAAAPPATPAPKPASTPPPGASPPRTEPAPAGRRMAGLLFSGMLWEQALVPGVAVGGAVGGGMSTHWLRADLTLSLVPAASATAAADSTRGADFTAGALAVRLCPGLVGSTLELFACASLRATRIWAQGTGVPERLTGQSDVLSTALGTLARWPGDSPWAAELGLDLVVPLSRPEFVIENVGRVYRVPAIGASGTLLLGHRF